MNTPTIPDAIVPRPGMIGLTLISGRVGAGIKWAQRFNGDGFSDWEHAFTLLPGNLILEAEPGGAVIRPLHYDRVYWCANIERLQPQVTNAQVLDVARSLEHVPYSFLDYDALLARRLHLPDWRVWPNRDSTEGVPREGLLTLREFVRDTGHMICSQEADEFKLRLGCHVFNDQRWPQDVTPGALWRRDLELTG